MPTFEIIDNFLPAGQYEQFASVVLGPNMAWYACDGVAHTGDGGGYFTHKLFERFEQRSSLFSLLDPFISFTECSAIFRAKFNLYPKTETITKHDMHVDADFPHKGVLYYVNSNNGVTTLEDGSEVESVANRLLLFNSASPHCSSTCTDQPFRVTMNLNYF